MDLILYNPLSKNAKSNIQTHKIVQYYKKNNLPFRLKSILKIKDMVKYLQDKDHIQKVILLGGDGTINRFVNNTADYDIRQEIYLKSNGTGNDFLRSLKLDDKEPQHIMEASYDNGNKIHFINGVGMGIDGLIGVEIDKSDRKGKFRYLINTFKGISKYIPEPATIIADGKEYKYDKVYLVVANNGKYFGGGMKITPNAQIHDEELDVVIAHTISKPLLILIFLTIYLGLHTKFTKYVTSFKASEITVNYTSPQISQADGELEHDVTSMTVRSSKKNIHLKYYDNKKR